MPAKSMEEIAALLKEMKFRKKTFGGVEEADVWKQLKSLQLEYQSAFDAQAERYEALLEERQAYICRLKQQLADLQAGHGDANG
ncbi:MAG: hypothetical protein LKE53_05205 [Oscillospiraceae bacterium]|nr:hypothetical protein [Oscillospiraceae bacterium]